jgi:predicted house-cleaning noncanonical NTP pyrophosphatase (MazG superfamily)
MSENISTIKPRQVRFVEKVDSHIRESAKRCHRSIQAEIAYRMELLIKLEEEKAMLSSSKNSEAQKCANTLGLLSNKSGKEIST